MHSHSVAAMGKVDKETFLQQEARGDGEPSRDVREVHCGTGNQVRETQGEDEGDGEGGGGQPQADQAGLRRHRSQGAPEHPQPAGQARDRAPLGDADGGGWTQTSQPDPRSHGQRQQSLCGAKVS